MVKYYEIRKSDYLYSIITVISILFLYAAGNWIEATVLLVVFIGLIIYLNSLYTYKKKKWEKFIVNVLGKMTTSVVKAMENEKIAITLIRASGEIIWYNNATLDLFSKKEHNFRIEDILLSKKEELLSLKSSGAIDAIIKEKEYHINVITVEHTEGEFDEDLKLLIFNDVSLIKEAEKKMVSVVTIEIDNYSDLIGSIDGERKPFLLAEIENFIYAYAHEIKALVRRYENSKFILIVSDYYISEEKRRKFPVLDKIKNINQGNTIEPTLSIGIGSMGASPEENHQLAKAAKELALGRGGDQVVIKTPVNLEFFGGSSKEIEKKSRVRSRVIATALKDIIKESRNVFIMGHKNPDMDCFGAAIGIKAIARGLKKKGFILLEEPFDNIVPLYEKFIVQEEYKQAIISPKRAREMLHKDDVLIIVDVHANTYVLDKALIDLFEKVIIIDHHRRAPDQITGTTLSYIETYASSTSELVTEIIQYIFEKPELTIMEAEALFAGIRVDTKSFSFKTGVRTFDAASFLKRQGSRTQEVREMFAYDLDSYNKKSDIIRSAKIVDNIAIAKVMESDDVLISAVAADELANFKNINGAFVLTKVDNDIIINGRSLKEMNVQIILEELGGGGHMTMAGATIMNSTLDEAYEALMNAITKHKKEENNA